MSFLRRSKAAPRVLAQGQPTFTALYSNSGRLRRAEIVLPSSEAWVVLSLSRKEAWELMSFLVRKLAFGSQPSSSKANLSEALQYLLDTTEFKL